MRHNPPRTHNGPGGTTHTEEGKTDLPHKHDARSPLICVWGPSFLLAKRQLVRERSLSAGAHTINDVLTSFSAVSTTDYTNAGIITPADAFRACVGLCARRRMPGKQWLACTDGCLIAYLTCFAWRPRRPWLRNGTRRTQETRRSSRLSRSARRCAVLVAAGSTCVGCEATFTQAGRGAPLAISRAALTIFPVLNLYESQLDLLLAYSKSPADAGAAANA